MRVQVDFGEWANHALKDSPAIRSGLLQIRPHLEVYAKQSVYETLKRGLRDLTERIVNESIREECDRALNPFQPNWHFWVLGLPAQVFSPRGEVHLSDSIGEATSFGGDVLTVGPRPRLEEQTAWLETAADKFVRATGLRAALKDSYLILVSTVLDRLLADWANVLRDLAQNPLSVPPSRWISEVRDSLANDFDKIFFGRFGAILPMILSRHEVAAYNEFLVQIGREFFRSYLVRVIYPSALWNQIFAWHEAILLEEIASRLWRFTMLQHRVQRTQDALSQGETIENLVGGSFGMAEFLREDEIVKWWFEKETVSLRYYLIGVLSFPESFLGLLKGRDIPGYNEEISKLLGPSAKQGESLAKTYLPRTPGSKLNVTDVLKRFLQQVPGGSPVLLGTPSLAEFISAHRYLQNEMDSTNCACLIFLYNELRNRMVHGVNFQAGSDGSLAFEHKKITYLADYNSLMLLFQMLPAGLLQIYKGLKADQP